MLSSRDYAAVQEWDGDFAETEKHSRLHGRFREPISKEVPDSMAPPSVLFADQIIGLPKKTSEGKYLRCSSQRGQVATRDSRGNVFTPAGTSRPRC
jgi:hypothetical protein